MSDVAKINGYDIKDATARAGLTGKQDTLVSGTNIKTINGESLLGSTDIAFDKIDSQGISGIWHYRKWASGYAEADGVYAFTPASWGSSGSVYYAYTGTINLPFTFVKRYSVLASVAAGPYVSWASANASGTPQNPASNSTNVAALVMQWGNATLSTIYVAFHVTGTWK